MQTARRRFLRTLLFGRFPPPPSPASSSIATLVRGSLDRSLPCATLAAPWSALQSRGAKVLGTDVRIGNVIQRKGRMYQVLKAQHTQHGRGGATIQVELRDVDTGNKITERFRTDEALERVFVEDKSFTYLYQEGEFVMLMEPNTFEQIEVQKEMFGKASAYLKGTKGLYWTMGSQSMHHLLLKLVRRSLLIQPMTHILQGQRSSIFEVKHAP
ncbi:uncharacterized protein LOC103990367 isoform X4 [Musa acuminata AAA Group]|uniref:uncharacterized protein LOC103990367 isoform X4 n=1 Tax=Musa acuminata AAA Group TaxID=214697 RepID=UPI0031D51052